ncbi:MAG TPA: hypothetical protein PLT66_03785 [Bacillota bacterium]|nr:hypothetical protein [Bacillota bacterium]
MKYSLLYKDLSGQTQPLSEFDKLFYDLSVDKAVSEFCPFPKRAAYFIDVLKCPVSSVDDIVFRQDILKDFLKSGKLLSDMKLIFNRYDSIRSDWNQLRQNVFPAAASGGYSSLLEYTYSQMQVTATFTRTIISYLRSFLSVLEEAELNSEGLKNIRDYCRTMTDNKAFDEIYTIASLFQYHTPEQFRFILHTHTDDTLRLIGSELTDITDKDTLHSAGIIKRIFASKKEKDISVALGDTESDDALFALNEALRSTADALFAVTSAVYELFFGISNEFMFYDAAVSYIRFLEQKSVSYVFPKMLEQYEDCFYAKELRDLILCCESTHKGEDIVPNDIAMGKGDRGILIRGSNGSGKTVFLRSVALAQIFAQAGLPVCADEAHISIRTLICAHFSSAEEEFREGDIAGRFEGEVQQIAAIVDKLKPHSLIFFNETFQTTSYDEGTDAIYTILSLLEGLGIQFIFVTHLTNLFGILSNEVRLMETDTGINRYKLREASIQ